MAKAKSQHIDDAIELLKEHLRKTGVDPESELGLEQIAAARTHLDGLKVDDIIQHTAEAKEFYKNFEYPDQKLADADAIKKVIEEIISIWHEYMTAAGANINSAESKAGLANLQVEMAAQGLPDLELRLAAAKSDLANFLKSQNKNQPAATGAANAQVSNDILDSDAKDKETLALLRKGLEEELKVIPGNMSGGGQGPTTSNKAGLPKPKVLAGQAAYYDTKTGQTHFDTIEQVRLIIKYNSKRFTQLA